MPSYRFFIVLLLLPLIADPALLSSLEQSSSIYLEKYNFLAVDILQHSTILITDSTLTFSFFSLCMSFTFTYAILFELDPTR